MLKRSLIVLMVMFGSVSLWAAPGVAGTAHDLTTAAWTGDATEDNGELCVYCHTPHAANTSFTGAPIWNKGTPAGPFTLYGTTVAGTDSGLAGDNATVNPSSMACLSCHDGVSAVNSVVNAPGAGLPTADGDQFIGTGAQTLVDLVGAGTASNIGTDLSNDHPVSIVYTEGAAGLRLKTFDISAWTGATTIQDVLRKGNDGLDYVECGSCHDPHNGADTSSASSVAFLRVSNAGSALCLGCHEK